MKRRSEPDLSDTRSFWSEVRRAGHAGTIVFVRDLCRPADEATARQWVDAYAAKESDLLREEFHRSLLSAYTVEEVRGQLDHAGLDTFMVERVTDRHLDVSGALV